MGIDSAFCDFFCSIVISSADHFMDSSEPHEASSIGAYCGLVSRTKSSDEVSNRKT